MTNEEIMQVVKPAICRQLKSPASAQFPVDLISIVGDEARGYKIDGFVDSQNSYGAMIRNDFNSSVAAKATVDRAKTFGVNYILLTILTALGGLILYFFISMMVGM